jgi:CO/xanthine dehydrogenase Mo-binding subunit
VRVIAPDVGGGFGAKGLSVEDVLVAWLARKTGKPVRWTETRTENMTAMHHGRAAILDVTLGGSREGEIGAISRSSSRSPRSRRSSTAASKRSSLRMPTAARNRDRDEGVVSTTLCERCCQPTGASSFTCEDRGRSSRCSVRSRRIAESGGSNGAVD